ncbi:MAG: hypothetical protein HY872_17095 [Chloroflexi bacterium]|nr:hypothetical protein [Chloroflexota bacterium]MBI5829678.1 hypothetical protein [Chloroflexota bacterium]
MLISEGALPTNWALTEDGVLVEFFAKAEIDGSTVITISELQQVVEAIDQKMSENLNPTPSP